MDELSVALEDLYRRRYAVFRDVLAGVTGDYENAREVVQEAFARALRHRRQFRGDGSLEAWVWRIAQRLAFRHRRDRSLVESVPELGAAHDPCEDDGLRAAIRTLPPKRRLVVFLRYFADLSYAEIAAACEIEEGTVAATLAQARRDLLARLETQEVDR
jgi:RNA polymerase sigma-70 factor, ECF subfamily